MGIFFPGKTICSFCNRAILGDDEKVTFPAFLPPSHKWHELSDGIFHRGCFDGWPEHEGFNKLYSQYREIWNSRPSHLKSAKEIEEWGKNALREFLDDEVKKTGAG